MTHKRIPQEIYSNRSLEWYGFEPLGYKLDGDRLGKLPVSVQPPEGESREVTFLDAWRLFVEQEVLELNRYDHVQVKVPAGTYVLDAKSNFLEQALAAFINITRKAQNPWYVTWCYWGHDHVTDDNHQAFEFFVAAEDTVVLERVAFTDRSGNGFDPTFFKDPAREPRAWLNDGRWELATVQSAYRRFYSETKTGQLLLLRPDRPPIYHYDHEQANTAAAIAALANEVARLRFRVGVILFIALVALLTYFLR